MTTYSQAQTESLNQQRQLLFSYSGLSTEMEFELKLNFIIDKLLEDKQFKKINKNELRRTLLEDALHVENQEPIFLNNERAYQKTLEDLSVRLKNNPESFLTALTEYQNTFGWP